MPFEETAYGEIHRVGENDEDEPARQYAVYVSLVKRAADVFGDPALASQWLSKSNQALEGKAPLQVLQDYHYSKIAIEQLIEPIFLRIEHGIYV